MATTNDEGVFVLEKGDIFKLAKELAKLHVGVFWDRPTSGRFLHDLDIHIIGLVHINGDANRPALYNGGSHVLSYSNITLQKVQDGFQTRDTSMWHSPDNREGGGVETGGHDHHDAHEGEELSEECVVRFDILPEPMQELAIWLTIHKPEERGLDFSKINGIALDVCDAADQNLCMYYPTGEFAGFTALQVGSFIERNNTDWEFHAVGAGSKGKNIIDIITAYRG